jgi:hypothetical protein
VLVALVLALAVLGFWSSDPRLAGVAFLNILGGLGLVSFSWRVVLASTPDALLTGTGASAPPRLVLSRQRCAVADCHPRGTDRRPLRRRGLYVVSGLCWKLVADGSRLGGPAGLCELAGAPPAGEAGGLSLHLLHRWSALLTLLVLGAAAWQALADGVTRRAAVALLVLLTAQLAIGALTVISGFSLWLAIAHGVGAAALLATLASLLHRG